MRNFMYKTGTPNDLKRFRTKIEPGNWPFLTSYLKHKSKSTKIIDIGCANGDIILGLIKKGYKEVEGIEYEKKVFETTLKFYPDVNIKKGNAENLKNKKNYYYDVCLSRHVLEHLPNPSSAVAEARRILKKNGAYLIGVPNGHHLDDIVKRFIQKIIYGRVDHLQAFSLSDISKLLIDNGFTIKKVKTYYGSLELLLDFRWGILKPLTRIFLYMPFKQIYYKELGWDILAIKSSN